MADRPSLSPDGETLVFEWRDDLWSVHSEGGVARRLTAHPAHDSHPRFSPDGQTLYFCSTRAGALQLFSMPADGGPATRHGFHSEGGTLEAIAPDGRHALIRGLRDAPGFRPFRLILIDLEQNAPEQQLFNDKGNSASFSADGSRIFFCREGEALDRKGYRGPRASSIWSYEPDHDRFSRHVVEDSEARSPMPWPDGLGFHYVSERDGTFNLWSHALADGSDRQLTSFEDDGVVHPSMSADGSTIVFRRGFDLWRHDVDGPSRPLEIRQSEDLADRSVELREIDGTVDADFSPSGLEIVFKAEGELWAMDTVLREPNRITHSEGVEDDPLFVADGNYVYFTYDDGLEVNVWRLSREDPSEFWWRAESFRREQVSFGPEPKSRFSISPDGDRLAWVSGAGDLTVANLDGSDPRVVFSSWNAPTYRWSPDGSWLAFAAEDQNFNRDIYLLPADGSAEPFNVSRHPDFEGSPRWSPDGSKLAFTGRRLNDEMNLFFVDLRLDHATRSSRSLRELEAEAAMVEDPFYERETEEEPETRDTPADKPAPPAGDGSGRDATPIDFRGLSDRIVWLDTGGIEPERLLWSHDSEHLFFQSTKSSDKTLYRIPARRDGRVESWHSKRGLPIRDTTSGLLWIVDRAPAVLRDDGKLERFRIGARMVRDRAAHQRLSFRLIWRNLRDRFYDPRMNGRDWDAMRAKYEEAAASAPGSSHFDRVVAMLLGELNASHLSFESDPWPSVWENEGAEFQTTRHLGIRFRRGEAGEPLRVADVIARSPAALCQPPVRSGDEILRVNGQPVDSSTPVHRFMSGRMDRDVEVTVRDADGEERCHRLEPITYDDATLLAEAQVVDESRQLVDEASGGKLGYVHIARMYWDEFEQFEREIYAAGHGKDGLVIDIRDNGGGFITDHLLTVLCQPRHAVTVQRGGGPGYPQHRKVYASWHKPLVVLCNQNSYSNAEIFAHAVKSLGRGKLVGTPTAGGVISADKDRILDVGTLRVPFRGWFLSESGEDMEMNGAVPDHLVWPTPDQLAAGEDPQLDKAIEVLMDELVDRHQEAFTPQYRNRAAAPPTESMKASGARGDHSRTPQPVARHR